MKVYKDTDTLVLVCVAFFFHFYSSLLLDPCFLSLLLPLHPLLPQSDRHLARRAEGEGQWERKDRAGGERMDRRKKIQRLGKRSTSSFVLCPPLYCCFPSPFIPPSLHPPSLPFSLWPFHRIDQRDRQRDREGKDALWYFGRLEGESQDERYRERESGQKKRRWSGKWDGEKGRKKGWSVWIFH